jgi:hypothetical protein
MLLQPNPHRESFTDGFAAERSNEYAVKWRWPERETPWELAANRSSSNRTHQSYRLGDIFTRTMILDTLISHMNSRRWQEVTLKFKKATTYAPEQKSDRKENDHDHGNCTTVRLIFLPAEKARSYRVRAESCRRKKGLRATIRIRHANTDHESRNISNDLSAIIYLYICPVRCRIQQNQQSNLERLVLDWINENRKMLIVVQLPWSWSFSFRSDFCSGAYVVAFLNFKVTSCHRREFIWEISVSRIMVLVKMSPSR